MKKKLKKIIQIGKVKIGGDHPVSIQSMTNTPTSDIKATARQIQDLEKAGCEIVRVSVPDMPAAAALRDIKKEINIPLIADIHFDYRLALASIENGCDGLRINPGNIKNRKKVAEIVKALKEKSLPCRIGVNAGSLDRSKYPHPSPEALVNSAFDHIKIFEDLGYDLIKISLKASDVRIMTQAYRLMHEQSAYPLHLGVTEAGTMRSCLIKSSMGIGSLLLDGIGDTIRVSLTGSPVEEPVIARDILRVLGLRSGGLSVISCPSCSRLSYNMFNLVERVEKEFADCRADIKVAVMGCIVNGPGEAREADLGIAGDSRGNIFLFKGGKTIKLENPGYEDIFLEEIKQSIKMKMP